MVAGPVVPSPAQPGSLRRAGFVSRLAANAIDLVVFELLFALALVGYGFARFLLTSHPFDVPDPGVVLTGAVHFVLLTAYLAWGWTSTGRTPGKAAVGLRVVTGRGQPLRLGRALARAAMCALFPLVLAWALVSRRNAGVHDLLLGTAVVYDWRPRRASTGTTLAGG